MHKRHNFHAAFTLIEVMVAVMIVSVVIAALLQIQANANNKLIELKKMIHTTQYGSFLFETSEKYGFEKSRIDMDVLLEDFELESELRRSMKALKVEILYEELELIDTSEFDINVSDEAGFGEQNSALVFEIGKTSLLSESFNGAFLRVRVQ